MILNLACIVEGHGEVQAVPVLLRRIATEIDAECHLEIPPPIRAKRQRLVKENTGELQRSLELALRKTPFPRAVLILIDADEDCPAELGPKLLQSAKKLRSDAIVSVVIAKMEFEAWFLAAFPSLSGKRGLKNELPAISNPEDIRDAKKTITGFMEKNRAYSETNDQAAFAAGFDCHLARCSVSFNKFWCEVERLLNEASGSPL